jgi:hypothetical protein
MCVALFAKSRREHYLHEWENTLALTIKERYEPVRILIKTDRERGYLLSNEFSDILPAETPFFSGD